MTDCVKGHPLLFHLNLKAQSLNPFCFSPVQGDDTCTTGLPAHKVYTSLGTSCHNVYT